MSRLLNDDALGRRVQKSVAGTTTNYLYSGQKLLAEYDPSWGLPNTQYVHGPGIDNVILRATSTAAQYYHQDGLNSVVAVTNNLGATDATQRFDAWGNKLSSTGTAPHFGYTGRELDETGLVFYRARYYDPTLGRFNRRDPIGHAGGLNLYAYVGNNVINALDPTGLAPGDVYALYPNSWSSRRIANNSGGDYSHIGIELSNGMFLQAEPGGVEIVSLSDAVNGRDYDVYRSVNMTTDAIPSIDNFAAYAEGIPYDYSAISGFPTLDGSEYVCSTLVADIVNYAGLGGITADPSRWVYDYPTPSDITRSDDFQLIGSSLLPGTLPTPPLSAEGGFVLYR